MSNVNKLKTMQIFLTECDLVALFPMGSHLQLSVETQAVTVELMVHADEVSLGHYSQGQHASIDSCGVVLLFAQDIRVFTVKLQVSLFETFNSL